MSREGLSFHVYDCFTDTRFGGNVGAIVMDADMLDDRQMQNIAKEMNAPVTGFVLAQDGSDVSARFFMPTAEIAMCGHVTIGLFTYLAEQSNANRQSFALKVPAGEVAIEVERDAGDVATVMMNLNVPQPIDIAVEVDALTDALGVPLPVLQGGPPVGAADAGLKHLFVPLPTEPDVRKLRPDFGKLNTISKLCGVHTVACFSIDNADPGKTLTIRDFCPAVGVNETPASGTTNGALAGYLLTHGLIEPKSQRIVADQGKEVDRPSTVVSEIDVKDGSIVRLGVGGTAVPSFSGCLHPL